MLDIEFCKSLKSKLSLVFKDEELESSFMNEIHLLILKFGTL